MDGFLGQFLKQTWPLITFIVGMFVLYFALFFYMRRRRKIGQQQKKAAIQSELNSKVKSTASIFDEYDNYEDFTDPVFSSVDDGLDDLLPASVVDDDDDPLAELYQAREEVQREQAMRSSQSMQPIVEEDDEEVVDLASLLAGMGEEEEEEEIVYHRVAENLVHVKLEGGSAIRAHEHISILRDERDARLMVQLGEIAYRTLINDKKAKTIFTKIMKRLSTIILKADVSDLEQVEVSDSADYHQVMEEIVHVKLEAGGETTARELVSILRDERDNRLMVQIDDIAYRSLINNAEAKSTFTKTMKELSGIILKADELAPAPPPPKTEPQTPSAIPSHVIDTIEKAKTYDDDEKEEVPGVINLPKMDDLPPTYSVGRFGRVKVNKRIEKAPELNIAEAIDTYLQYKIEQTPEFQKRGIYIRPALDGGVRINVEGNSYDAVDDVADEIVRAFIKQAIQEWQDQH